LTPQEEQLLNALVERVNQTQLQEKDPDAEALLNRSLEPNPDALYILAQTVLVQNIALDQARAQVAQLQQQVQQARQPAHATSFLGSLLGRREPESAPPQPQPQVPVSGSWSGQYQPVPQYAQGAPPQQYGQTQVPQPQYIPVAAGQPSFLRGAVQTAAGVAAGALAFEGVESILHGFGHPAYGCGSPGLAGGGFDHPVEETVINNYYDDPNPHGGLEHRGLGQGGEHQFHDSADHDSANLGSAQLNDASYVTSGDGNELDTSDRGDSSNYDSSDFDNSGNDGSSGFDDSGSFDDGGGFDSGGGDIL
jgi:hypothetical protein